jgi:hypothetical protein
MKIKSLQQGGAAPAPAQSGGPEEQLAQMAQQIIEQLGPEAAAMLAQMLVQMLEGAAAQQAPPAPTYQRKGGKLIRK